MSAIVKRGTESADSTSEGLSSIASRNAEPGRCNDRAVAFAAVSLALGSATSGSMAAAQAATGLVRIRVVNVGFILGAGGGQGALSLHGRVYPFSVGGIGVGTFGASAAEPWVGLQFALALPSRRDLHGGGRRGCRGWRHSGHETAQCEWRRAGASRRSGRASAECGCQRRHDHDAPTAPDRWVLHRAATGELSSAPAACGVTLHSWSIPVWVLMYIFSYSVSPAATNDRAEWRLLPTAAFQEFSMKSGVERRNLR